MRDIIFRGKRMDNGEWVYGNLFVPDLENSPTEILVGTNVVRISYEVDSDTVGQYTGLHDINNKPIYENDILKKDFGSEQIGVQYAFVYYSVEYSGFMTKPVNDWMFTKSSDCEVVGNIYDNPELLEATP